MQNHITTQITQTTYRCPLMSDWSQMPPSDIRWKLRPMVVAMERPMLVLPTPGGPTKHSIGPICIWTMLWWCLLTAGTILNKMNMHLNPVKL